MHVRYMYIGLWSNSLVERDHNDGVRKEGRNEGKVKRKKCLQKNTGACGLEVSAANG